MPIKTVEIASGVYSAAQLMCYLQLVKSRSEAMRVSSLGAIYIDGSQAFGSERFELGKDQEIELRFMGHDLIIRGK